MDFFLYFGVFCFVCLCLLGVLVLYHCTLEIYNKYSWKKYNASEDYWRERLGGNIKQLTTSRFVNWTKDAPDGYVPTKFGLFVYLLGDCVSKSKDNWNDDAGLALQMLAKLIEGDESYSEESVKADMRKLIIRLDDKTRDTVDSYLDRIFKEENKNV